MKSTGLVRKVDDLGRIVLPKELRDVFNIEQKDSIEIFREDEMIILRKYKPEGCIITGEWPGQIMNLSGGIKLSYEGAEIISQEIKEKLKSDSLR
ncbi:AbrB/MazE/SpoVT family DNA-binding domain-containing protein [Bacillus velezensis]|uniref:AbrB/MazE/SpoVT family DNA-binding domain-containing protein n=1 Tax=Bacillus velezensis TaxID=492670 RepID=UPI0021B09CA2|nr:AbrB/MazE/SpoVT family DNA-binding domain-containing protein [Bacillus velezensis]MCT6684592.1 AbrB/MazE/SpoVT family DNA-binding domain-containing protein [Bacillus velezensis]